MSPQRPPSLSPQAQLEILHHLDLDALPHRGEFAATLTAQAWPQLTRAPLEIFQINLGKLCNMTCSHCHVDAGPTRTREIMTRETVEACLRALDLTTAHTVDMTGGAPEMNPQFRYLVEQCVARGKKVIDRCNLTVLRLPGMQDLPAWFAQHRVEIIASLPDFTAAGTDGQRGDGTFAESIAALQALNAVGYGQGDPERQLVLVSNPVKPELAKYNPCIHQAWQRQLKENYGITFDRLITLNNMPIARYLHYLQAEGTLTNYLHLLIHAFNPKTIAGLMCRTTLSVAWDGTLYDCDFNQMLELPILAANGQPLLIHDFTPDAITQQPIRTDRHCFGCTAGAGSSCSGAIAA